MTCTNPYLKGVSFLSIARVHVFGFILCLLILLNSDNFYSRNIYERYNYSASFAIPVQLPSLSISPIELSSYTDYKYGTIYLSNQCGIKMSQARKFVSLQSQRYLDYYVTNQNSQKDGNGNVRLSSSNEEATQPTELHSKDEKHFNLEKSTEYNYAYHNLDFHGQYPHIRARIDYNYHSNYTPQRQHIQDKVIQDIFEKNNSTITDSNGNSCDTPTFPWVVFTAGAMGAGKTYTVRHLAAKERFPLNQFVAVDPDDIRRRLPEWELYLEHDAETAGEQTRKEAGLIAELLIQIALGDGKNVLVDGSLKDSKWYKEYFLELKNDFNHKRLKIGILHISAPEEAVLERSRQRSKITKRVVPQHILEESIRKVPQSVRILSPLADFVAELDNSPSSSDIELVTKGMTWSMFKNVWSQTCTEPLEGNLNEVLEGMDHELGDSTHRILS